jgi:nucleoside-diphosphate-sugar epimerase
MVLQGKRALVTGASRGIGAAVAKKLAAHGADVAITYEKSADRATEIVRAIQSHGRKGAAIQADGVDVVASAGVDTENGRRTRRSRYSGEQRRNHQAYRSQGHVGRRHRGAHQCQRPITDHRQQSGSPSSEGGQ